MNYQRSSDRIAACLLFGADIYTPIKGDFLCPIPPASPSSDAVPLGAGDFAQLKQPKGHMLGDTEKEIRFAYVGLAVSSRLLSRQPNLVERFLRAVVKGREYARRYREQTIPIIGKYTQRKREFNEFDYDSTLAVLTSEGWVSDDILKEDVAVRAELVGVAPPADYPKFFDYSIVKKIYGELKRTGWKPAP